MRRPSSWVARVTSGQLLGQDNPITASVVTDSRLAEAGSLYVARRGESADGHDFVPSAVENGAVAVLVEHPIDGLPAGVAQIVVSDATDALGMLARAYLRELRRGDLSVIGITGSAGKTTTKDLVARLLSAQAPTVASIRSFNNEVGVPLTILRADEDTRFLVLEMGASALGHLRYLASIAPLDVAVELMVGTAHLGGFGSQAGIAQAKQELVEGLVDGGSAVLNADDHLVMAMAEVSPGLVFTFSQYSDRHANVYADQVHIDQDDRAHFLLHIGDQAEQVDLHLVGAHHIHNALAAASVGHLLGVPITDIASIMSRATADSPHRMDVSVQTLAGHSITLIDDSYNANQDSMMASLAAARRIAGSGRVVAVLGEMLELGEASSQIHQRVGQAAADNQVATIIGLGAGARDYAHGIGAENVVLAGSVDEAITVLKDTVDHGDVVLVKGSNGSQAWKVADTVRGAQA